MKDLADRARGYGIPGMVVDGNDVLAVYDATVRARQLCLNGEGPVLMECKTFRVKGHAEHDDPSKYVPAKLLEEWKQKDPVDRYVKHLLDQKILSGTDIQTLEEEIEMLLRNSLQEALESPFPSPEEAGKGVFAN